MLANPNVSPFYGVGDPAWDAAHRGLRGEYYIDEADGKKVKMQSQYAPGEDRPDLFLVLPAPERQRVVEYLDVQSLCRMEQVMQNVYSLLAWYEALRGAWIPSVSAWPRYTSANKFAGLRWSMNRRVELRGVKICSVFVEGEGEYRDEGIIFFKLCEKQRWTDIACLLVESGSMDPNSTYTDVDGSETPVLMTASFRGRLNVVKALAKAGADVDKAANDGCTPLMTASIEGHPAIAQALIQAGADVDIDNENGVTALMGACGKGHSVAAEVLIQAGADVDKAAANSKGVTALVLASMLGHIATTEILIQAGADVDKAENDGTTALIVASQHGHAAIVEVLIQAGADIDKADNDGRTALMMACEKGHTTIVEALIQAGADVHSFHGIVALIVAYRDGHSAIVKLLEDASAAG